MKGSQFAIPLIIIGLIIVAGWIDETSADESTSTNKCYVCWSVEGCKKQPKKEETCKKDYSGQIAWKTGNAPAPRDIIWACYKWPKPDGTISSAGCAVTRTGNQTDEKGCDERGMCFCYEDLCNGDF